jgi:LAS superfamily LD-carboxypeptidase LdcB
MDTLKQVRVRKIVEGANTGALDLRVMLLQGTASNSQRIAVGKVSLSGQLYWQEVIYDGERYQTKTNDEIIQEYISSNSEFEANKIGSKLGPNLFKIVQNPWADDVPQLRKFGEDPYYLNNGAYINISWRKNLEITYQFEAYEVYGNGTASDPTKILVDTAILLDGLSPADIDVELPNFFEINYKTSTGTGSIDEFYGVTLSNTYTLSSALAHAQNSALNDGFEQGTGDYVISVSGVSVDLTLPKTGPSSFTRNISGYEYSDESLKEVNTPNYIFKSFYVVPNPVVQPSADDEGDEEFERFWSFDDKYNPRYVLEFAGGITNSTIPLSITFSYEVKDEFIVNNVIENWVKSLATSYPSARSYNLRLAVPSYTYPETDLINDYSPKKSFTDSGKVFKWETVGDNPNVLTPNPATGGSGSAAIAATQSEPVVLIKMNPVFPENWIVKTDEPAPQFQIWVGDIEADVPVEGFIFSDEADDLSGLSPEFLEEAFVGEDEQIDFNLNDAEQSEFGESGGLEEETEGSTTTEGTSTVAAETASTGTPEVEVSAKTATDSASKGGGSGQKRFQQKLTVQGRTVFNGDLPSNLLTKLDFCGHKIEKNAVKKLNELNKAYKAQFGKDMKITDGYRTFNVQNKIFDWDYYDTGLNPYTKKVDPKNKGRKVGSFTAKKPTGVAAAPPGTSKHGWGQAVDIGGFGNGPGNQYFDWMEANAKKYGWINPKWAKKAGAGYEPWHWEYNGTDLFKP